MKMWRTLPSPLVKLGFFAMGTQISVSVSAPGSRRRREAAGEAIAEVERMMQTFGKHWWPWGNGELSRINRRLAEGGVAEIPVAMRVLFGRAWAISRASGGLYEPRIAQLVQLWGFHDLAAMRQTPPEPAQVGHYLQALRAAPAYDGGATYGPAPDVGWDFGGIGKGWIVDAALDLLRDRGFPDAVVDAGGNLAARGARGDNPWRIGIRDPRSDPLSPRLVATLMAHDEAVNTHGDDQRYFEVDGRRYAHILDPATGCPASGLRSLTVVHADGTLAEAAGAALYVAGRQHWPQMARKLGLADVLAVNEDGEVEATAHLAKRIRPENGTQIRSVG